MGGLDLKDSLGQLAPQISLGILIIVVSVMGSFVAKRSMQRILRGLEWERGVIKLVTGTLQYGIVAFGVLTGLDTAGVKMVPVVAGLGLGGFALGFALRDALSNFLAGLLILVYRPFRIGDYLSVSGCEGVVSEINLRYTVLQGEKEEMMVPNSVLFTTPLRVKNAAIKD